MNLKTMAHRAASRIGPFIRTTPLEHSPPFSKETGVEVWLKLECLQYTRSFKVRGALNRLQTLTVQERGRGVVTASTGNHGLATAYGLGRLGLTGTIYLPETASPRKIELLRAAGADLVFHGADSAETEAFARQQAGIQEKVYISPYNDPEVVAGQGTLGIELLDQLPELASVFVPVGGGGLIGGIAGYLKTVRPSVRVIGCLPARSPVMYECIQAGRIVDGTVLPTISDGTAGGVEEDAITFELCRQYVDDWIVTPEEAIEDAMRSVFEEHSLVIEGAAGLGLAALRSYSRDDRDALSPAVLVLCGGNIEIDRFKKIVC